MKTVQSESGFLLDPELDPISTQESTNTQQTCLAVAAVSGLGCGNGVGDICTGLDEGQVNVGQSGVVSQ